MTEAAFSWKGQGGTAGLQGCVVVATVGSLGAGVAATGGSTLTAS